MSREFEYKQRPATTEYRENWDRVYGPTSCSTPPAAEHTPEAAGPLAGSEASGVPASKGKTDETYACSVCGSTTYATLRVSHETYPLAICNGCGATL
jgi:hypothetical protein